MAHPTNLSRVPSGARPCTAPAASRTKGRKSLRSLQKFDQGATTRYIYDAAAAKYEPTKSARRMPPMSVNYYKRFRMEIDLRGQRFVPLYVPPGYRLLPWQPDQLAAHAEAKFQSFRHEIDAGVFSCLSELAGCYRLMDEISHKDGFLPSATWLAVYSGDGRHAEYCGTIQGIRATHKYGAIQNVGITPAHRGQGLGTALICASLAGFQQTGLPRAYLEVTAQNDGAVRLYKRLGFRRTKTLFKAVELAYS